MMTKIRRLLVLFAMIISTCQLLPANDIRQLLQLLDKAIDNRQVTIVQRQTELNGLKQMLSRTPAYIFITVSFIDIYNLLTLPIHSTRSFSNYICVIFATQKNNVTQYHFIV